MPDHRRYFYRYNKATHLKSLSKSIVDSYKIWNRILSYLPPNRRRLMCMMNKDLYQRTKEYIEHNEKQETRKRLAPVENDFSKFNDYILVPDEQRKPTQTSEYMTPNQINEIEKRAESNLDYADMIDIEKQRQLKLSELGDVYTQER